MITLTDDYLTDRLCDFIDIDLPENAYEEILSYAIESAREEYDCATVDGEWTDCTDYAGIAARAESAWEVTAYDSYCERGDYLRGLREGD